MTLEQELDQRKRMRKFTRGLVITLSIVVLSFIFGAVLARGGVGYAMTSDERWGQAQTLNEIAEKAEAIRDQLDTMTVLGIEQSAIVSAYNSEVSQTDDTPFHMADGRHVFDGAIASNCHPFGTKIVVGERIYEVADRMNRRYNCTKDVIYLDIWMEEKEQALIFGRQNVNVVVIHGESKT